MTLWPRYAIQQPERAPVGERRTIIGHVLRVNGSAYQNTRDLISYLLAEGGLLRSPIFLYVVAASASRTAMIFAINETAERGGADFWMFVLLIGTVVVSLSASHLARLTGHALVEGLAKKMRRRISFRILDADVSFFQNRDHGKIHAAVTGQSDAVAGATMRLVDMIQAVLMLVMCLGYIFIQSWPSALATLAALGLGTLAFMATEVHARRLFHGAHAARIAFHDTVNDLLRGYKELRLRDARRNDLSDRVDQVIEEARQRAVESERYFSLGQVGASAALAVLLVSVVVMLPLVVGTDSVTILQIVTVVLFSFGPIESMVSGLPGFVRASVAFRMIREVEDDLKRNAEPAKVRSDLDHRPGFGTLELRGVTAVLSRQTQAPGSKATDSFTLGPVDLTLRPGQSVFITGGNGMGKSTLLQILTGLRHPDAGEILVDGVPVTRETIGGYRALFSAVFSEFYLFRHLYGLNDREKAELQLNIEELGLAEGVSVIDNRFASLSLSTGQMRRLALSIALAEKRPIIVLDEFAADQDPVRRAFFYDVLVPRLARAGHLVLAVTHDEQCFDKCDRLIRMEDGKVVSDKLLTDVPADRAVTERSA